MVATGAKWHGPQASTTGEGEARERSSGAEDGDTVTPSIIATYYETGVAREKRVYRKSSAENDRGTDTQTPTAILRRGVRMAVQTSER
jgi:hypothetical protein